MPDWPGHLAGQHLDVRLTAPDGYRASRSYSIASAWPADGIELTVEQVPDGEVSPYLVDVLKVGDPLELRGPVGGWFVWKPEQDGPVQLIGGGSGVVPLMAMLRAHAARRQRDAGPAPVLRTQPAVGDLRGRPEGGGRVRPRRRHLRLHPGGAGGGAAASGGSTPSCSTRLAFQPEDEPTTYVCGPTPFVETVADLLVAAGHDPARVRTERFGPTGGS